MIQRTKKYFLRILEVLCLLLLVNVSLLAWRISIAPLHLNFLRPYIQEILNINSTTYQFKLNTIIVYWSKWTSTLEIQLTGFEVQTTTGQHIVSVPVLSVSFNYKSTNTVKRQEVIPIDYSDISEWVTRNFLVFPYLERIQFINARVILDSQVSNSVKVISNLDLTLTQRGNGNINRRIEVISQFFLHIEEGIIPVTLVIHRNQDLLLTFSNLRLSSVSPNIPVIWNANLPVSGTMLIALQDPSYHIRFSLNSGIGIVSSPSLYNIHCNINQLSLQGTIDFLEDEIKTIFEYATADFGGPKLVATATTNIQTKVVKKILDSIPPLWVVPQIPRIISFVTKSFSQLSIDTRITLTKISIKDLVFYWPEKVAPDLKAWIKNSLHNGLIEQTDLALTISGNASQMKLENLYGEISIQNATINYLKPMPPVCKVEASIVLYSDRVEITMHSGNINTLHLINGVIIVTDLDRMDQYCSVDLTISGKIAEAFLTIVNRELLEHTSMKLKFIHGNIAARLELTFPVEKNLTVEQVALKAQMQFTDIALSLMSGYNLDHGTFTFVIDNEKIHISGNTIVEGVDVKIEWYEFFDRHSSPLKSYCIVHSLVDNKRQQALLVQPYIQGQMKVDVILAVGFNKLGTLTVELDLTASRIELLNLKWNKPLDQRTLLVGVIYLSADQVCAIPNFKIQVGEEIYGSGYIDFTPIGYFQKVFFDCFKFNRTLLIGTLSLDHGFIIVRMSGPSFDLVPFLHLTKALLTSDSKLMPNLVLEFTTKRLWSSIDKFFMDAKITARRENGYWQHSNARAYMPVNIDGITSVDIVTITLSNQIVTRNSNQVHTLLNMEVTSNNVGALLYTLNLFDNVIGGRLWLAASFSTDGAHGIIKVHDYHLINAPLLARLLTIAALTGILESLSDSGLYFTNLDMIFTYHRNLLSIDNLHTFGPSLGLTASGQILSQEQVNIEGTIIPAYIFNSLLGNIPIFGELITGGKENGLFAVGYTVTGSLPNPTITVNPFTVITPGFLRNLFKVFSVYLNYKDK